MLWESVQVQSGPGPGWEVLRDKWQHQRRSRARHRCTSQSRWDKLLRWVLVGKCLCPGS